MALRTETVARMDRLVKELVGEFEHFVAVFDEARRFKGPSLYFHYKTLERREKRPSVSGALHDDCFVESLYATLASWGMHRMGTTGAQMVDFDDFKRSLLSQLPRIQVIEQFQARHDAKGQGVKLSMVSAEEVPILTRNVWSAIDGLNIGRSRAKTVIGSKALHHLLPELVPPIDRRYTLRFFLNRMNFPRSEFDAFEKIFHYFSFIGLSCAARIETLISTRSDKGEPYGYMRTSATKLIDNAIVGYGIERLGIKEETEEEG